jgi:hypothetical protein
LEGEPPGQGIFRFSSCLPPFACMKCNTRDGAAHIAHSSVHQVSGWAPAAMTCCPADF